MSPLVAQGAGVGPISPRAPLHNVRHGREDMVRLVETHSLADKLHGGDHDGRLWVWKLLGEELEGEVEVVDQVAHVILLSEGGDERADLFVRGAPRIFHCQSLDDAEQGDLSLALGGHARSFGRRRRRGGRPRGGAAWLHAQTSLKNRASVLWSYVADSGTDLGALSRRRGRAPASSASTDPNAVQTQSVHWAQEELLGGSDLTSAIRTSPPTRRTAAGHPPPSPRCPTPLPSRVSARRRRRGPGAARRGPWPCG